MAADVVEHRCCWPVVTKRASAERDWRSTSSGRSARGHGALAPRRTRPGPSRRAGRRLVGHLDPRRPGDAAAARQSRRRRRAGDGLGSGCAVAARRCPDPARRRRRPRGLRAGASRGGQGVAPVPGMAHCCGRGAPSTLHVAAVIEQKVTGLEARTAWRVLLRRFGEPAPGTGDGAVVPADSGFRRRPRSGARSPTAELRAAPE